VRLRVRASAAVGARMGVWESQSAALENFRDSVPGAVASTTTPAFAMGSGPFTRAGLLRPHPMLLGWLTACSAACPRTACDVPNACGCRAPTPHPHTQHKRRSFLFILMNTQFTTVSFENSTQNTDCARYVCTALQRKYRVHVQSCAESRDMFFLFGLGVGPSSLSL
jgi:hypothetical protein